MIKIIATMTLIAGLAVSSPTDAQESCLHRDDFRKVHRTVLSNTPMARERIHRLFGTRGRPVGYHTRVYSGCVKGSRVWLQFERDDEGTVRVGSDAYTGKYFGAGLPVAHPAKEMK